MGDVHGWDWKCFWDDGLAVVSTVSPCLVSIFSGVTEMMGLVEYVAVGSATGRSLVDCRKSECEQLKTRCMDGL